MARPPLRPRPITDPERFGATLSDPLAIFNATAQLPADVVLWPDALRHLTRLSRVLRLTPAQAPPLRPLVPLVLGGGMGCRISRPGCGGHNRNNKDQHLLIYLMFQNGVARMFHTDNTDVPIRSSQFRFGQFSFGSHLHLLIILSLRYSFVFPFVK